MGSSLGHVVVAGLRGPARALGLRSEGDRDEMHLHSAQHLQILLDPRDAQAVGLTPVMLKRVEESVELHGYRAACQRTTFNYSHALGAPLPTRARATLEANRPYAIMTHDRCQTVTLSDLGFEMCDTDNDDHETISAFKRHKAFLERHESD